MNWPEHPDQSGTLPREGHEFIAATMSNFHWAIVSTKAVYGGCASCITGGWLAGVTEAACWKVTCSGFPHILDTTLTMLLSLPLGCLEVLLLGLAKLFSACTVIGLLELVHCPDPLLLLVLCTFLPLGGMMILVCKCWRMLIFLKVFYLGVCCWCLVNGIVISIGWLLLGRLCRAG